MYIDGLVILIQKENGTIGGNSKNEVFGEKVSRRKPYTYSADQRKGWKVTQHLYMAKYTDCGELLIIHRGTEGAVVSYAISFCSLSARSD